MESNKDIFSAPEFLTCWKCGRAKFLSRFYEYKPGKFETRCKDCLNEKQKARYRQNPDIKEKERKRMQVVRTNPDAYAVILERNRLAYHAEREHHRKRHQEWKEKRNARLSARLCACGCGERLAKRTGESIARWEKRTLASLACVVRWRNQERTRRYEQHCDELREAAMRAKFEAARRELETA